MKDVKLPAVPFTMAEFIALNKLGVSPHDVPAVRVITEYLKRCGLTRSRRRRKGDVEVCWDDGKRLDELKARLK